MSKFEISIISSDFCIAALSAKVIENGIREIVVNSQFFLSRESSNQIRSIIRECMGDWLESDRISSEESRSVIGPLSRAPHLSVTEIVDPCRLNDIFCFILFDMQGEFLSECVGDRFVNVQIENPLIGGSINTVLSKMIERFAGLYLWDINYLRSVFTSNLSSIIRTLTVYYNHLVTSLDIRQHLSKLRTTIIRQDDG